MKNSESNTLATNYQLPATSSIPHINAPKCNSITGVSNSNFVKSFQFLPKEKTDALTKIYAFCRIVDDCVDEPSSREEKQTALDYWKNETLLIHDGTPAHAVTKEIAEVVQRFQIPKDYLLGLVHGCQMDINKSRYQTYIELKDYCYHVAGLVGLICLKIFEYESPTAKKMAVDLGLAFQLTNIMRDIRDDIKLNRVYLPQEDIEKFGYSEEELLNLTDNEAFKELMKLYYSRALEYYKSAFEEFARDKEGKLIAAKVMAKTYFKIFKKMKKQNFPVLRKKVSLNYFEKALIIIPLFFKRSRN